MDHDRAVELAAEPGLVWRAEVVAVLEGLLELPFFVCFVEQVGRFVVAEAREGRQDVFELFRIAADDGELGGAVGDVAGRHFDLEGAPVNRREEEHMLAVTRDQLRDAGTVIGVAAGTVKAASIVGAARAGLIDVLVTDAPTASAALEVLSA